MIALNKEINDRKLFKIHTDLNKNSHRKKVLLRKALSLKHWGSGLFKLVAYVLLIDLAFVFLYPFLYVFSTSLKTGSDIVDVTIKWIPRSFSYQNYITAFNILEYPKFVVNSLILSVVPMIGHVLSCSFVGYGFARFKFVGKELLFTLAMFTLIIPPQSIIIPLYMQYNTMNWMNSYLPIIIPSFFGAGLKGALFIFIFRQAFRGLPMELEDAARVDGCNVFRTYFNIVLPLVKPAILVTSIIAIVWHWNDYFEPQVFLTSKPKFTLPMLMPGLQSSFDQYTGGQASESFNWPIVMASSAMIMLPMLIMYMILQRQFMKGIERTGLTE